ncbi:MAG: lycopene cyclase domain-containing protein [Candidatus Micrarchaeia archaeon]
MKEYTILCIVSLVLVFLADSIMKTKVRERKFFLCALALALITQLVVDNITAWRGFWSFNEEMILGIHLPVIPFENLLFGISLFYATIISWERGSMFKYHVCKSKL